MTTLTNPKDPILKTGPGMQKDLFDSLVKNCSGHQQDIVIGAAVNLLVNAIRQTYPSRQMAEQRFDEIFGRSKQLLVDHYDSNTGRRRSVFPFTQVIEMPHIVDKDRKH